MRASAAGEHCRRARGWRWRGRGGGRGAAQPGPGPQGRGCGGGAGWQAGVGGGGAAAAGRGGAAGGAARQPRGCWDGGGGGGQAGPPCAHRLSMRVRASAARTRSFRGLAAIRRVRGDPRCGGRSPPKHHDAKAPTQAHYDRAASRAAHGRVLAAGRGGAGGPSARPPPRCAAQQEPVAAAGVRQPAAAAACRRAAAGPGVQRARAGRLFRGPGAGPPHGRGAPAAGTQGVGRPRPEGDVQPGARARAGRRAGRGRGGGAVAPGEEESLSAFVHGEGSTAGPAMLAWQLSSWPACAPSRRGLGGATTTRWSGARTASPACPTSWPARTLAAAGGQPWARCVGGWPEGSGQQHDWLGRQLHAAPAPTRCPHHGASQAYGGAMIAVGAASTAFHATPPTHR